ncbi:MAG: hypothetical protein HQ582_32380 [Planctomycetes bacterium]|nr:hypothetical protein [Planctomycetota bacterium]
MTAPASRMVSNPAAALATLLLSILVAGRCQPASGDVAAGPGGHWIRHQDRLQVLVGDSGTQCVLQNANIDHRRWIADCAAAGLNAVHVWAFVAPRQTRDGRIVEQRYGYGYPGLTPWARRPEGKVAANGWPRWDLREFDEGTDPRCHYWPRLRDLCSEARNAGLVVGVSVFFGWPKHNTPERPDWTFHPFNRLNGGHLDERRAMVEVVQEIASPGREILARPWGEDFSDAEKTQWVWERLAEKLIAETRPFGNVFFVFMDERSYSEGNCGDHFAAFFRGRGAFWVDGQLRRNRVDGVVGRHGPGRDLNREARETFDSDPPRPLFELESPPYAGDSVRQNLYACLLGGGHYFFHNDEGQETPTTGIMAYDPNVADSRIDMVRRRQRWLGIAARLMNRQVARLEGMRPANQMIKQGAGCCLARPGEEYVVYFPHGGQARLHLGPQAAEFTARLVDPRSGKSTSIAPTTLGEEVQLSLPDESDWLVHLVRRR